MAGLIWQWVVLLGWLVASLSVAVRRPSGFTVGFLVSCALLLTGFLAISGPAYVRRWRDGALPLTFVTGTSRPGWAYYRDAKDRYYIAFSRWDVGCHPHGHGPAACHCRRVGLLVLRGTAAP